MPSQNSIGEDLPYFSDEEDDDDIVIPNPPKLNKK